MLADAPTALNYLWKSIRLQLRVTDQRHRFAGRVKGSVEVSIAVGGRHESRLEGRGREVDAPLEHTVKEDTEMIGVGFAGVIEVLDGARVEKEAEHRPDHGGVERDSCLGGHARERH